MNKDKFLGISVVINILLVIILMGLIVSTVDKLRFSYIRESSIGTDVLISSLDMENYGVMARFSHPIRGGADIPSDDKDLYMIGEYADIIFLKNVYEKTGDTGTCDSMEKRAAEIRSELPDYAVIFDKIDQSIEKATDVDAPVISSEDQDL